MGRPPGAPLGTRYSRQAIQAISVGFELLLGLILVFLSLAYMLMDGQSFFHYVLRFVPPEHRAHVERLSTEIHRVLGRYLRGQLLLIALMSAVTFSILEWGFHLPYALWVGMMIALTVVNYGFPIAQLALLKDAYVPVVPIGSRP